MSPPPGQEKWRQGSGGPQESTSSFSQRSSPALFPLLQPWPFLQVQDGVGEKREIHLTSKPDFEVPPSLHRGTFLYGTPHNVCGHSEPARLLQLRHLSHECRWDGAKGGQARIGLSELSIHPVLYLGGKKVTVGTWMGGRQIPSSPGHQLKCRNRSGAREDRECSSLERAAGKGGSLGLEKEGTVSALSLIQVSLVGPLYPQT